MDRGDIYHVSLDPIKGREQAGRRYVLIVSTREFNRLGTPLVCPITQGGNFARDRGFAVSLSGTGSIAQGVVLCNQSRVLDLQSRGAGFVEKVPPAIVDEVIARLQTLLE
jgi:mRNA-degrading endonuclease toxin of MazEF toxin-antitoxin module